MYQSKARSEEWCMLRKVNISGMAAQDGASVG